VIHPSFSLCLIGTGITPHASNIQPSAGSQILMIIAVSIFTWYAFKTPSFADAEKPAAEKKTE
jgi:hypothetical protein